VLACVPLDESVPFKDVSDLCGIPEAQLCRVTRLMATSGFFHEPRLGHIAHSPLSAQFVTNPALLDAVMFLSETAAPTALKMPLATKQFVTSRPADQSAYAAAVDTGNPLASEFELRPRLQRQYDNYLSCITGDDQTGIRDVLMKVDWGSLGDATVVDVSRLVHFPSVGPEPRPLLNLTKPLPKPFPKPLMLTTNPITNYRSVLPHHQQQLSSDPSSRPSTSSYRPTNHPQPGPPP
jgi:hypothetical protein